MNDEVTNPNHYNQQGIEVIDVIEAYELPYHLGNVIKYVCRHSYKGKPLQDLQKALWYLSRYVEDLEAGEEAVKEALADESWLDWQDFPGIDSDDFEHSEVTRDEYGRVTRCAPPVNIEGKTFCEEDLTEPESVVDALYVRTSPSRIAGDDDAAVRLKNAYYDHEPFLIVGYCANCDKELSADCDHLRQQTGYETEVKFCSLSCVEKLREWQGR